MTLVKKTKAQIMVLDMFIFLIIILLIISIQTNLIKTYNENIYFQENKIKLLEKEYLIDLELLDCNFLGYLDKNTKKCYRNKINLENIEKIPEKYCIIKIDDDEILNQNKKISSTHKKAIIYNNQFTILEVSYCEN